MPRNSIPPRRSSLPCALLIGCTLLLAQPTQTWADTDDGERAQLAAMARQLDQIERQAKLASAMPRDRSRYHLDYVRLQVDLQRVRRGIQDYLTPPRAQPRDVTPLSSTYRVDGETDAPARQAPQFEEVKP